VLLTAGCQTICPLKHGIFNLEAPIGQQGLQGRKEMASNPLAASLNRGVAQSGSAPALGAGGREFESRRPDHLLSELES
jgi:hypothetical protein